MTHSFTFDILCFTLSKHYALEKMNGYLEDYFISNVKIGEIPHQTTVFEAHTLYIMEDTSYLSLGSTPMAGAFILIKTKDNDKKALWGNAVLINPLDSAFYEIQNQIFQSFLSFKDFQVKFVQMAAKEIRPEQFLSELSHYMDVRFIISSTGGDIHCFDTKQEDTLGIFSQSQEEVEEIMSTQPAFPHSFSTHSVQPFPSPYNGLLYYYNIFLEDTYIARILCVIENKPFIEGQIQLFRMVAPNAAELYIKEYKKTKILRRNPELSALLEQITNGFDPDPDRMDETLKTSGWSRSDTYQVLLFHTDNLDQNQPSQNYFCSCIDGHFPSCCSIVAFGNIYCIRNLSSEKSPSDFMKHAANFSRDNLCKTGISNIRKGIEKIPVLTQEASIALTLGTSHKPERWIFQFEDWIFESVRDAVTSRHPIEEIEHPALPILRAHDAKYGSSLVETLRVYTEERFSPSEASRKLYIHRSTFLHRIERIQELTGLSFEHKKDRTWLVLSFLLQSSI